MQICGYGLVVEPQPSKLMARVRLPLPAPEKIEVNGTLLTREIGKKSAHIAQSVEHFLGKEEVIGSNPIVSTICCAEGRGVKVNGACRDDKHRISEQKASE